MRSLAAIALLLAATPLAAKDSLGMFEGWGAFRDDAATRREFLAMVGKPTGGEMNLG